MTRPLTLSLPGNGTFAARLNEELCGELGEIETRRFPDSETYLRLLSEVAGRDVVLVCTLDRPDAKLPSLIFAADAARELGARSVGLVAPYLAYMRQDRRFQSGEAVTSRSFARLLSGSLHWLATADPHLHRYTSLDEIYRVTTRVVHAAKLIADWIRGNVDRPLLIGPDTESEQWVAEVAAGAGAPYVVCSKQRLGDRNVRIELPDLIPFQGRQPVLVDDIASSARTLCGTARQLIDSGWPRPVCIVVHPLFAEGAFEALRGVSSHIVSTDTIGHQSNAISMASPLAASIRGFFKEREALASPDIAFSQPS